MEIKSKHCKGTGLAKGFGCNKLTPFRHYGLCSSCYPDWLLNSENGKIKMAKALNKVQAPRKSLEKAEKEKKELTSLKLAHNTTKTAVHSFVRERDAGKPCISCGVLWNKEFQAGHYYPAGSFETLKYDLDNIHGQCVQCNLYKEGNFENYTLRLPLRIGKEAFDRIVKLAGIDKQFQKFWDVDKLKSIREQIKQWKK
jgi:Bacteriophage Lambda NinG protein